PSTSTVSTTRHISISCCQSRLLRAKRDTSRAATAPTLPRQTSATIRSKPARATPPAAGRAGLAHVDDRPARQVVGLDLVRGHGGGLLRSARSRRAAAAAAPTRPVSA